MPFKRNVLAAGFLVCNRGRGTGRWWWRRRWWWCRGGRRGRRQRFRRDEWDRSRCPEREPWLRGDQHNSWFSGESSIWLYRRIKRNVEGELAKQHSNGDRVEHDKFDGRHGLLMRCVRGLGSVAARRQAATLSDRLAYVSAAQHRRASSALLDDCRGRHQFANGGNKSSSARFNSSRVVLRHGSQYLCHVPGFWSGRLGVMKRVNTVRSGNRTAISAITGRMHRRIEVRLGGTPRFIFIVRTRLRKHPAQMPCAERFVALH
jgi:hypothetical protein